MQRREFLGVLGGAAVAWPRAIHAQEAGCIYRLGIMTPSLKIAASPIFAFFDELRVFGFVEGQNLKVMVAAMVCATSNFPCIHREPKASSAGGP
jgi:putative ABC transport system substrate-binding protein